MQNLSDNDLDKHFQEAAEKYRPPFDPAAWSAMQQRLNKAADATPDKPPLVRRALPVLLIFLAGSITGILTWSYLTSNVSYDEEINVHYTNPLEEIVPPEENGTPAPAAVIVPETTTVDEQRGIDEIHISSSHVNKLTEESRPRVWNSERKSHRNNDHGAGTDQSNKPDASTIKADQTKADETIPQHDDPPPPPGTVSKNIPMEDPAVSNKADGFAAMSDQTFKKQIEIIAQVVSDSTKSPSFTREHVSDPKEANDEPAIHGRRPTYRLSLIAALSPDFSSVNFREQTKPGKNFAGLVAVHITARLSVMSGVISSTKLYRARDVEYYGHAYPDAEGDCRIIDIPLNLYYQLNGTGRYSLFAGAGLSSYIMKKESYVFYYDSPYGPASYNKEVRNKNNEWFKVMNISLGVSRQISHRIHIEAEPFVKIPLSGVGEGKLDVSTFGMFLRARYSFLKTQ